MSEESEALARVLDALAAVQDDVLRLWHMGDGNGGLIVERIKERYGRSDIFSPRLPARPSGRGKEHEISAQMRKEVYERDAYRCVTCSGWHDLTCDHIVPVSKGGPTTLGNLQTMCHSCNARKGARTP